MTPSGPTRLVVQPADCRTEASSTQNRSTPPAFDAGLGEINTARTALHHIAAVPLPRSAERRCESPDPTASEPDRGAYQPPADETRLSCDRVADLAQPLQRASVALEEAPVVADRPCF